MTQIDISNARNAVPQQLRLRFWKSVASALQIHIMLGRTARETTLSVA